jgi:hypothetical protein
MLGRLCLFLLALGIGVKAQGQYKASRPNDKSQSTIRAFGAASNAKNLPPNTEVFFDLPPGFNVEPDIDEKQPPVAIGGKIVKIRQGPFTVAPGEQLESEKQWIAPINLPCLDCYITAIQGGLEFEDGTPAFVDSGAFLQVGCDISHAIFPILNLPSISTSTQQAQKIGFVDIGIFFVQIDCMQQEMNERQFDSTEMGQSMVSTYHQTKKWLFDLMLSIPETNPLHSIWLR